MSEHVSEPVLVHIAGSDLPLTDHRPAPTRKRRGVSLRSFTLTANDPVQQILPLNTNRCEAWAQALTNPITVYGSRADAQAGTGGITIPATNTVPYPLNTTDPIWATAAILPTTVSVTAIIEGD
jgi:hypothetical protein